MKLDRISQAVDDILAGKLDAYPFELVPLSDEVITLNPNALDYYTFMSHLDDLSSRSSGGDREALDELTAYEFTQLESIATICRHVVFKLSEIHKATRRSLEYYRAMNNVIRYCNLLLPGVIAIATMKSMMAIYKLPINETNCPEFKEFIRLYGKRISQK